MSNRTLRINELVQRELSGILRRRYQSEAVALTITGVQVSPDLRDGRVFVSVLGDQSTAEEKLRWIRRLAPSLREELSRLITLKYMPKFDYVLDESGARGVRVQQLLDELSDEQK